MKEKNFYFDQALVKATSFTQSFSHLDDSKSFPQNNSWFHTFRLYSSSVTHVSTPGNPGHLALPLHVVTSGELAQRAVHVCLKAFPEPGWLAPGL